MMGCVIIFFFVPENSFSSRKTLYSLTLMAVSGIELDLVCSLRELKVEIS